MSKPYQVVVTFGDVAADLSEVRVAALPAAGALDVPEVAEDGAVSHRFIDAFREAGLTPSDMRSRVLFVADEAASVPEAVAAYALTCFFAGRRVDFRFNNEFTFASPIDERGRNLADNGRPAEPADEVVADDIASLLSTAAGVTDVRYARRVRLNPTAPLHHALVTFLAVSAVRARGNTERLPLIAEGDVVVDTDVFRRAAAQLRRSARAIDPSSIAERAPGSARSRTMLLAQTVPAPAAMLALGAVSPGNGFWHCPRPERHTNGDANASMRVEPARVRCFRCDAESVDVVRLAADVKGLSFTEAAEWLLADVAPRVDELLATVPDGAVASADDQLA